MTDPAREQILHLADRARHGNLSPDEGGLLADAVAVMNARVTEYEHMINWHTNCTSCARILDSAYTETMRAEKAEAALARVRTWSVGPCPENHEMTGDRALGYNQAMAEIAQFLAGNGPVTAPEKANDADTTESSHYGPGVYGGWEKHRGFRHGCPAPDCGPQGVHIEETTGPESVMIHLPYSIYLDPKSESVEIDTDVDMLRELRDVIDRHLAARDAK